MRYLKLLLLPFSWLYGIIMDIRNRLFDSGIMQSVRFSLPVIAVGNLSAGGSGKTPMIEYLIRLLKDEFKITTLSRGYRRKTSGVIIAGISDNAETLGDEPYQLYKKFHPEITVAVGEDRIFAVPYILRDHPETEIFLLDDAFQHRRISPSLQILVTDFNRLFYRDFILPAGMLRESRSGARRADIIVVTKCPAEIQEGTMSEITRRIHSFTGKSRPVFFSSILYERPKEWNTENRKITRKIILVTGIADPGPLVEFLRSTHEIIEHFRFSDHHYFTEKEIRRMISCYERSDSRDVSFLFTEKDLIRLEGSAAGNKLNPYPVYFQPITYKFVSNGKDFNHMIIHSIKAFNN